MKQLLAGLILLANISLHAQDTKPIEKPRTVFLGFGVGYVNAVTLRLGWQISGKFSIAAVNNIYPGGEGTQMNIVATLGLRASLYFDKYVTFMNFNSINIEGGYWYDAVPVRSFELTLSREGIFKKFLNGYYSVGFGIYSNSSKKTIFGPSLKIGFNINI